MIFTDRILPSILTESIESDFSLTGMMYIHYYKESTKINIKICFQFQVNQYPDVTRKIAIYITISLEVPTFKIAKNLFDNRRYTRFIIV